MTRGMLLACVLTTLVASSGCWLERGEAIRHEVRGRNALLRGDRQKAVALFEKAIKADASYPRAHSSRALPLILPPPKDSKVPIAEERADLSEAYQSVRVDVSLQEARRDRREKISVLDRLRIGHDDSPDEAALLAPIAVLKKIGVRWIEQTDTTKGQAQEVLDEAIAQFRRATRLKSGFASRHRRLLAELECFRGQASCLGAVEGDGWRQTLEHCDKAVAADPEYAEGHYWYALALQRRAGFLGKRSYKHYKLYLALGGERPMARDLVDLYEKNLK